MVNKLNVNNNEMFNCVGGRLRDATKHKNRLLGSTCAKSPFCDEGLGRFNSLYGIFPTFILCGGILCIILLWM